MVTNYEAVYSVVKRIFESAEYTNGDEQDSMNVLRKGDAFTPELSLVAKADEKIVGHIMFTRAAVDKEPILVLASPFILPEYQQKRVGRAPVQEGHKIAKELGYTHTIVLGSGKYYPKSGYSPAEGFEVNAPPDVPSENFMACVLNETGAGVHGATKYAPEFGIERYRFPQGGVWYK